MKGKKEKLQVTLDLIITLKTWGMGVPLTITSIAPGGGGTTIHPATSGLVLERKGGRRTAAKYAHIASREWGKVGKKAPYLENVRQERKKRLGGKIYMLRTENRVNGVFCTEP